MSWAKKNTGLGYQIVLHLCLYRNADCLTECSEGRGGHPNPELAIVEILDENGMPVADGEIGEVAVTTLGVEGMPLLRYKTGDLAGR